jgi:Spherulation-specific family 4
VADRPVNRKEIATGHPPLLVPAYFHPAVRARDWARLVDLAAEVRLIVLNVGDGAGDAPDDAFRPVLADLRAAGSTIAGYVDTDYGARPRAGVLVDLDRYQRWYGVRNVFFDRVCTDPGHVEHYGELADTAREHGAEVVAFNHGAHPADGYTDQADLLGTFEGPWRRYLDAVIPTRFRTGPSDKFFHLVHSVPRQHLGDALRLAGRRNVGAVYVTDQAGTNPWRHLPGDPPEPETVNP